MSKVTLDEKVCLKHKLTLQEVLIALAVRAGSTNETVKSLLEREVIVERNGDFLITQHWSDVLDEVLCDSENKGIDLSDERLLALAKKVQECFPIMKMRYASGQDSPFYFRCNKTEIKNKLKKFLTIYGDVADEDIIDATKRYVATYASKGYLGMRLAKYFILKDDRKLGADEEVHVEQLSDLATFLENKGSEEEEATNDDDWLISSRN
jgi:sulfur carrier protein ThiS